MDTNFNIFYCTVCHICKSSSSSPETTKFCSGCKLVHYCCTSHQKDDWPNHKDFLWRSVLVALALNLLQVHAYSEGAPEEVCNDLIPKHLTPPQDTPCPYRIELSTYSCSSNPIKYNPIGGNQMINITLTGVQGFKGFIIQARMNSRIVGRFEPSPLYYKMLDCPEGDENTATHTNNDIKDEVILKWVPPTKVAGQVWFYATVVRTFDFFWVHITSDPLELTLPEAS